VRAALRAALEHPDPVYIRLGKKGEPVANPDRMTRVQLAADAK